MSVIKTVTFGETPKEKALLLEFKPPANIAHRIVFLSTNLIQFKTHYLDRGERTGISVYCLEEEGNDCYACDIGIKTSTYFVIPVAVLSLDQSGNVLSPTDSTVKVKYMKLSNKKYLAVGEIVRSLRKEEEIYQVDVNVICEDTIYRNMDFNVSRSAGTLESKPEMVKSLLEEYDKFDIFSMLSNSFTSEGMSTFLSGTAFAVPASPNIPSTSRPQLIETETSASDLLADLDG